MDAKRRLRATLMLGFAHAARQLIAEYLSLSLSIYLSLSRYLMEEGPATV
jgi:hypothetical protein